MTPMKSEPKINKSAFLYLGEGAQKAGKVTDIRETRDLLVRQISEPVKWMQSMEHMLSEGIDIFVEIGPGSTLAKFMKAIAPKARVLNISEWNDIEMAVRQIKEW